MILYLQKGQSQPQLQLRLIVRTTDSNAAIILVILRSFSEFEELPTAVYHLYAEIVRKLFVLEYLEFLS